MSEGTTKFFDDTRGWGFIRGDDDTDYFVHGTDIQPGSALVEGARVHFDPAPGKPGKGPKAVNVQKITD
jgi:CspA family cold shock protein